MMEKLLVRWCEYLKIYVKKLKSVYVLFCFVLTACGSETSGEAIETNENILEKTVVIENIGDNEYMLVKSQERLGNLEYSQIPAEQFLIDYFILSNQVSSTQFMLSEPQTFVIPESVVSFGINFNTPLAGRDVFIGELENPSGLKIPLWGLIPCFDGTCSMVIPNQPNAYFQPEAGEWKYRVLAEREVVNRGKLDTATINMIIRTNENFGAEPLPTLRVQPYYAGNDILEADIIDIMNQLELLFLSNGIGVDWRKAIHIAPNEFASMPPSYNDVKTNILMSYGEANVINVHFVKSIDEQYEGTSTHVYPGMSEEVRTILGIAAGIPGSMGTKGNANGVMVSLAIDSEGGSVFRSAAEVAKVAAHEIGHFIGLFHTTERTGRTDPLDDTPFCELSESGFLPAAEDCPDGFNLMFPHLRSDGQVGGLLTDDQRFVIANSPMAQ